MEDGGRQHGTRRVLRGRRVLPGQQPGQFPARAGAHRVEQREPLDARTGPPTGRRVVDGRHGGPGEEPPGGLRVGEVPVLLQVRVEGLLDGPYPGLPGHVAQRGLQVAPHLHRAHDPVALHEQRGAQQPRGAVHVGLGRHVLGQQPGGLRLAAGPYGEGQGVPHDVAADAGRGARLTGCRAPAVGLPQDAVAQRVGVTDAGLQGLDGVQVLVAVDPGQEGRGALPLAGQQPLGRVLQRLAELVADVTRNGGDPVADAFVGVQELLLHAVVDVQHQDDPYAGTVERGYRHAARVRRHGRGVRGDRRVRGIRGRGIRRYDGRDRHPAHLFSGGLLVDWGDRHWRGPCRRGVTVAQARSWAVPAGSANQEG